MKRQRLEITRTSHEGFEHIINIIIREQVSMDEM